MFYALSDCGEDLPGVSTVNNNNDANRRGSDDADDDDDVRFRHFSSVWIGPKVQFGALVASAGKPMGYCDRITPKKFCNRFTKMQAW